MKKIITLLFMVWLTACGSQPTKEYSSLTDQELSMQFEQALDEIPPAHCERLLPLASEVSRRDQANREKLRVKRFSTIQCAIDEGRLYYAYELILDYEKEFGVSTGLLGFRVAYASNKPADAIARLETLSRSQNPNQFLSIEPNYFWSFFHRLVLYRESGYQRKVIEIMIRSPYFQKVQPDVRSGLATRKLTIAVEEGDLTEVDKWISYISGPELFLQLLSDRKFEAIWPNLEQAVGKNFKKVTDKYLKELVDVYRETPSDLIAYQAVADALVYAGRFEEAVDFVRTPNETQFAAITKEEAWAINRKVDALDALGRHAEATALFDSLVLIPVTKGNELWLINFAINRAVRFSGYGQWEQAYKAITYAENFKANSIAKMMMNRVKTCALANQGEKVSLLVSKLYKHREDSYVNAALGLMCGGEPVMAGEVLIEALDNETGRRELLELIQEPLVTFQVVRPNIPLLRDLLISQEEFLQAFEKEARLIPDRFIPVAQLN